jgi:hypothetical protein
MTPKPLKNPSASIRQRLLNHAKAHGDDYQRILTRYAIERLLFRLSQTEAREGYILKGAMLFVTWPEQVFRPTGDLDLLGHGDPDPGAITELFTRICQVEMPADGIIFDPLTLQVEAVREDEKYQGVRLSLSGRLGTAVIPVQVDIGFGDRVYPPPSRKSFPSLLSDMPAADVLMYPPETVVAEKFEAMIRFGETNGRIKDFLYLGRGRRRHAPTAGDHCADGDASGADSAVCRHGGQTSALDRVFAPQPADIAAATVRRATGGVAAVLRAGTHCSRFAGERERSLEPRPRRLGVKCNWRATLRAEQH